MDHSAHDRIIKRNPTASTNDRRITAIRISVCLFTGWNRSLTFEPCGHGEVFQVDGLCAKSAVRARHKYSTSVELLQA